MRMANGPADGPSETLTSWQEGSKIDVAKKDGLTTRRLFLRNKKARQTAIVRRGADR